MKEDLKLYAGIATKSVLKWLFIVCSGWILTLIFLIIMLFQYYGTGHGKVAALILVLLSVLFCFLYVVVANKVAIQTLIYDFWTKKGIQLVKPVLSTAVHQITNNQHWLKEVSNDAMLRARLIDASKNNKTTAKNTRRILVFSLKRIQLDDIDFQNEKLSLYDVLLDKLLQYFATFVEPDFLWFWVLLLLQVLLFSTAQYLHLG
jgi:hypothetical protein